MEKTHSMLDTTFPVFTPLMPELQFERVKFDDYVASLAERQAIKAEPAAGKMGSKKHVKSEQPGQITENEDEFQETNETDVKGDAPFMNALLANEAAIPTLDDRDGKMLTENADVAHRTSREPLVDAFFELEDAISGQRLREVLQRAWADDPQATLKIIWNARSIHLGKSSRSVFYRAVGWLAEEHPVTLLRNLPWLVRPLIPKKAPQVESPANAKAGTKPAWTADVVVQSTDQEDDFELVDARDTAESQPAAKQPPLDEGSDLAEYDVKHGVAHGYWKDLLHILALAANDELKADGDPRRVLNSDGPTGSVKKERDWTKGRKKGIIAERYDRANTKLEKDPFYRALHLTVARLFAEQLKLDMARLQSGSKAEVKRITLAAKWAPSHKGMHDQHTCIVSSIAELLHPFHKVCPHVDPADRTTYLKHARQAYQLETLSPLRKALEVVERPITSEKFEDIKYNRVPSLAMKRYTPLFAKKDTDRFDKFIDEAAQGKVRISGATLLPSTLVRAVLEPKIDTKRSKKSVVNALVDKKLREMQLRSLDAQWRTLTQRIKDSGTLESSIAVCDVSGSMYAPRFPDGTCPMYSSIGLSLLLAEITKPPFGGAFITFSQHPQVMRVGGPDDKRSLREKIDYISKSSWSMNTDFVAVFERLILPMAVDNKLTQEDMVKQVFVFSDMHFDTADYRADRWTTSYERIKAKFAKAGYELPRLIFWNLAGGWSTFYGGDTDPAPKPVTADEEGTALVSGYSQAQMKMFLDNGHFEDPEETEEVRDEEVEGGEEVVIMKEVKKRKQDPLSVVRKAISHDAYRMLKVFG